MSLTVGGGPKDSAKLDARLVDADVVVDATGSQAAARVLQRRCREFDKPLVCLADRRQLWRRSGGLSAGWPLLITASPWAKQTTASPSRARVHEATQPPGDGALQPFQVLGLTSLRPHWPALRRRNDCPRKRQVHDLPHDRRRRRQFPRRGSLVERTTENSSRLSTMCMSGVVLLDTCAQALIEHETRKRPRTETAVAIPAYRW